MSTREKLFFPQAEIQMVTAGKCRRLLLAKELGEQGELLIPAYEPGRVLSLRPREFVKGVKVTVTGMSLVMLDTVPRPWITAGARLTDQVQVWLVDFVLGDHAKFYEDHAERYLKAKGTGTTTNVAQALMTEPAVTSEYELQLAERAHERRDLEDRQLLKREKQRIERSLDRLRARGLDDEIDKDLRFIQRRLATIDRRLDEAA